MMIMHAWQAGGKTSPLLGDLEREFLGEPSDSEVDEEELNRCSDDDVDADFDS